MSTKSMGAGNEGTFSACDLSSSVKGRAVSGGLMTVGAQSLKFVLNLGGMMLLGRLLDPRDFGMMGIVLGITAFLAMFTDMGLSSATVQSDEITDAQASNLFWINIGLSGVMGAIAVALAPLIAWFYRDPRLSGVTMALAVTFPLTGLAYQHRAILIRQMKFGRLAAIEVGSLLFGMGLACAMAITGFGYWSLVALQVGLAASALAITLCLTRWIPSLPSRSGRAPHLLQFGVELSASSFVYYLSRGTDSMLLGRFWGEAITGYYTRAMALLIRPIDQVLSPIGSVMLPLLGRLRSDPARYRRVFLQVYNALGLVFFPMAAIFLVASHPLVVLVLGAKWEPSVPLFAGFTIAIVYLPYATSAIWVFTSQGRSRDQLIQSIVLNGLVAASFAAGAPGGALSMVLWYSISGLVLRLPILFYLMSRKGSISGWDMTRGMLIHLPLWAAAFASARLGQFASKDFSLIGQLVVIFSAGIAGSLLLIALLKPQRASARLVFSAVAQAVAERRKRDSGGEDPLPANV